MRSGNRLLAVASMAIGLGLAVAVPGFSADDATPSAPPATPTSELAAPTQAPCKFGPNECQWEIAELPPAFVGCWRMARGDGALFFELREQIRDCRVTETDERGETREIGVVYIASPLEKEQAELTFTGDIHITMSLRLLYMENDEVTAEFSHHGSGAVYADRVASILKRADAAALARDKKSAYVECRVIGCATGGDDADRPWQVDAEITRAFADFAPVGTGLRMRMKSPRLLFAGIDPDAPDLQHAYYLSATPEQIQAAAVPPAEEKK